jgi:putative selenium metabolism hydrolase
MASSPSFDAALRFARDLIRIPSLPGHEGAVAERVREEFVRLGFAEVAVDDVGNVIGVVRGKNGGPRVMLSSHLDIVAAGDEDAWEHPPFAGAVAGGFLHGRGAMDIKGPLAIQTYAAAALAGRAAGDVIVAHTVLEERGGLGMQYLLDSQRVAPDAVVIGEATHGDVCIGHRGRAEVEIVIHGLAGHASAPSRALNALALLPAVLEGCWELRGDQPSDPLLGAATVTPTSVEVLPESRNVIPDRVTLVLDWRILPDTDERGLLARVEEVIGARLPDLPDGFGVEVRMTEEEQSTYTGVKRQKAMLSPGFLLSPEHPVARAAAQAVGRRGGSGPATVRPWTFATDGGWTCGVHGIPTIGFAPGEERYAHTNRERLDLEEARWALERYPEMVVAIQDALARGGR